MKIFNMIFQSNILQNESSFVIDAINQECDYSLFDSNIYGAAYPAASGNCEFGEFILSEVDPLLNENYYPKWNATEKSPCIDTGDPTLLDPDGTPSDIGAYRCLIDHKYDFVELPDPSPGSEHGIKWLSFPALDNIYSTDTYDPDQAYWLLYDILFPFEEPALFQVWYKVPFIFQFDEFWYNDDFTFPRTSGYKFLMNEAATLEISGFKEPDNTAISLDGEGEENWIGYWLEETQKVQDAFSDYWEDGNIYYIQHQNWTAIIEDDEWHFKLIQGDAPTISYGDMVIVKCCEDISEFRWDNSTPPEPDNKSLETDYFSFVEQPGYTPIFVEFAAGDLPQEIGAFVDGVCIGATVVEDTLAQINAYTSSVPPGNIELQLYYGSRSSQQNKKLTKYNYKSHNNPYQMQQQINTGKRADAWFVSLREDSSFIPAPDKVSLSNYPNPFNPATIISYSLPVKDHVKLGIYNIKGQLVKQLVSGVQSEGYYEIVWNGKDSSGKTAASGIYYSRITTCGKTLNKKMLMLK